MASTTKEMQNAGCYKEADNASKTIVWSVVISLNFALCFKLD